METTKRKVSAGPLITVDVKLQRMRQDRNILFCLGLFSASLAGTIAYFGIGGELYAYVPEKTAAAAAIFFAISAFIGIVGALRLDEKINPPQRELDAEAITRETKMMVERTYRREAQRTKEIADRGFVTTARSNRVVAPIEQPEPTFNAQQEQYAAWIASDDIARIMVRAKNISKR